MFSKSVLFSDKHSTKDDKSEKSSQEEDIPKKPVSVSTRRSICDVPMGIKQNPWTPTKRRGPIAAESNSPGPASVAIPTVIGRPPLQSTIKRAPAYSFGLKPEMVTGAKPAPGPASYNVEGVTVKGKIEPPASSMHARLSISRKEVLPAPCDYDPNPTVALKKPPAFTMAAKLTQAGTFLTPAPNMYKIPTVIGESVIGGKPAAPAFSIKSRTRPGVDPMTLIPGPGAYTPSFNVQKNAPAYTIKSRNYMPFDDSIPGPNHYVAEKVCLDKTWAPAPSFGIRHSQYLGKTRQYSAPDNVIKSLPVI